MTLIASIQAVPLSGLILQDTQKLDIRFLCLPLLNH